MSQAIEQHLPSRTADAQAAQVRPAVRSAAMLAAALVLTIVGMTLVYAVVLFVES